MYQRILVAGEPDEGHLPGLLGGQPGLLSPVLGEDDVDVGHAYVSDLALLLELGHRRPALLDVPVRVGPVDLGEVNGVHPEPAQAGLALPPDGVGRQTVADLPTLVPHHAALGEHVRPVTDHFERSGHDLFGVAQSVDGCRVDPVDAADTSASRTGMVQGRVTGRAPGACGVRRVRRCLFCPRQRKQRPRRTPKAPSLLPSGAWF
jgi:hypothetical protein